METSTFDYLPAEIIYIIFNFLDGKAFLTSRKVCKKWRAIADKLAEDPQLWLNLCEKDYPYTHKSVARRSKLSWFNVFKNIHLWFRIGWAKEYQRVLLKFKDEEIKSCCVFRDMLIVVCTGSIKYYDIDKLYLLKEITGVYSDCQENEYFALLVKGDKELMLCGKTDEEATFSDDTVCEIGNVELYCTYENKCYFLSSKKDLWCCKWTNGQWRQSFLARYYGSSEVKCMSMYCDEVYLMTKAGAILKPTPNRMFMRVESARYPSYVSNPVFLINASDVVYAASSGGSFQVKTDRQRVEIECPELSCIKEHANMLILGTSNGDIEIYSRTKSSVHPIPERVLSVGVPPEREQIVALEVHEREFAQEILACTARRVHKITYTHDVT